MMVVECVGGVFNGKEILVPQGTFEVKIPTSAGFGSEPESNTPFSFIESETYFIGQGYAYHKDVFKDNETENKKN